MDTLEKYRKQGWAFAIWLGTGGYIIQGSTDGKDHDWDFDVQATDFAGAVARATSEIINLEGREMAELAE